MTSFPNRSSRRQLLGAALWAAGAIALPLPLSCRPSRSTAAPQCAGEPAAAPGALTPKDLELLASAASDGLPIMQRLAGERGVLRNLAKEVTAADVAALPGLEQQMRATLSRTGSGVGLAASQIAVGARVILVKLGARGHSPRVELFVNPRIVERSDEIGRDYEGCLSIPGVCGLVRRSLQLIVEHGLPGDAPQRLETSDFEARIFQHEIDHLDGVLYIDRVEGELQPMDRLKELREQLRASARTPRQQPQVAAAHQRPALL